MKVIELELIWPEKVSLDHLRPWLIEQISAYSDPLRWAITAVKPLKGDHLIRQLTVEAVVSIP